jgi:hypothetical protein
MEELKKQINEMTPLQKLALVVYIVENIQMSPLTIPFIVDPLILAAYRAIRQLGETMEKSMASKDE